MDKICSIYCTVYVSGIFLPHSGIRHLWLICAIIRANTRLKLPDAMVLATAVQLHADFLVSNDVGFPDVYKNVRHVGSKEMSERPK